MLLHGVPETALMWQALFAELARDRTVLAPDLKGMGASEVKPPYDVPTLVDELAALIRRQVDEPIDLVGHDWGGALAIAIARFEPGLVRRLVIVNAPYRKVNYVRAAHIPFFALPVVPELLFRVGGTRLLRAMLHGAGRRKDRPLDEETAMAYAQPYRDMTRVRAMLGYYRWVARRRLSGRVRHGLLDGDVGAQSVLVVWGARDSVLPLSVGDAVVRDVGVPVQYVTLPDAGHWPVEEEEEIAVPTIARFIRSGNAY